MNEIINREAAWQLLTEFTQSESLRKHALAVEACMRACARKYSERDNAQTEGNEREGHEFTRAVKAADAGSEECRSSEERTSEDAAYRGRAALQGRVSFRNESGALAPEGISDEDLWGVVGLIHDFDYDRYPSLDDHPYKGNEILKQRGWPEPISRAVMSHAEYTGITRDSAMEKALFACDELAGFITAVTLIKPSKSLAEVDVKSVRKRMKDKAFARKVNRDDIINGAAALGVDLDEHIALCIDAMKTVAAELGLDGSAAKPA
jgi:predicted hydrolase (HD superfamily)